tara:strand:- start:132 stop:977 length:846 start_codon:yes stop_codon:yes gene_type:complete
MVAGASGQIGREIVQNLSKSNKIFAIYRKKKNFFDLKNKNIKWIKFDLSKKIKLRINPKIIINCAATHEFSPQKNLKNYLDSNVISMANLIAFAKEKKVKKIINLSTISVYGTIDVNLLHEDYIPINQNLLGRTKYISEYLLYNQPINFINLRLPGILCSSKNYSRPWLKTIINKIKNNEKIKIYNEKNNFNSVIDVEEITKLILEVIKNNKIIRNTFNLSASESIRLGSAIKKIKKYYNSSSQIISLKNKKKSYLISVKKIKKILKFSTASVSKIINRNL